MSRNIALEVATALCRVNPLAGQSYYKDPAQSVESRAQNLIRLGYVHEGDPFKWGGPGAVSTIRMEPKGIKDDCVPPLDYYETGIGQASLASDLLGDHYIGFVNPTVACVYRTGGHNR